MTRNYEVVGCYMCNHVFIIYRSFQNHRYHCKGAHFDRLFTFARRKNSLKPLTHDEYYARNFDHND